MIPAGWRHEEHLTTTTLHQFPLYSTWNTKEMSRVQLVVPRGQPHLPTTNRIVGNPARLQDRVSVIMEVIYPMP